MINDHSMPLPDPLLLQQSGCALLVNHQDCLPACLPVLFARPLCMQSSAHTSASLQPSKMMSCCAGSLTGVLWCVVLTPDDKYAVTGSEDFTARIWQLSSGQCMRQMAGHKGWIMAVAVTPDGNRVLTASHDGTAR